MPTSLKRSWSADNRREAIERPDAAKIAVLVPGIELCPLVGMQSGAHDLFTGLLRLAPKANYPLYARPFTEALILLEGDAAADVEERRYRLGPFDALMVPARLPRRVVNLSQNHSAVIHVSVAGSTPDQTWINGRFTPVGQPTSSTGRLDAERFCRSNPAARSELAPQARFQDLFSAAPAREGSVAATVSSKLEHGCPVIATSSTNRSPSCKALPPASSRGAAMSCRATRRHSCQKACATISST